VTEFLVYCLFGAVVFLFMALRLNTPKQHNWHEVSSADVAKAIRKRKRPR